MAKIAKPIPITEISHTVGREQIIALAMDCMDWPLARSVSWYTKENRWFNYNSPRELVQRGEQQTVIDFLFNRKRLRGQSDEST